eukprot:scaffold1053_cov332-Pavlova_lutheri.AAC.20
MNTPLPLGNSLEDPPLPDRPVSNAPLLSRAPKSTNQKQVLNHYPPPIAIAKTVYLLAQSRNQST